MISRAVKIREIQDELSFAHWNSRLIGPVGGGGCSRAILAARDGVESAVARPYDIIGRNNELDEISMAYLAKMLSRWTGAGESLETFWSHLRPNTGSTISS